MSFPALATSICFIAVHGGPADHFATFSKHLSEKSEVACYASGPALGKFREHGVEVKKTFSLDTLSSEEEDVLAEEIAKSCACFNTIITDVGHLFDIKLQEALVKYATSSRIYAYYDNPEPYVPGGYSEIADQVKKIALKTLYANANLAEGISSAVGIGYYPIEKAEEITKLRETEKKSLRQQLFLEHNLVDRGQKVLVYFGGNNTAYFDQAFPAFLSLLEEGTHQSDLSNLVIVIQQHPGAKKENLDTNLVSVWLDKNELNLQAPKIIVSNFSSDRAQVIADAALYYQTSMGPQFVLAGIPTIQIGHETYSDILVKNKLSPSITNVDTLITTLNGLSLDQKEVSKDVILEGLGIKHDWLNRLESEILR